MPRTDSGPYKVGSGTGLEGGGVRGGREVALTSSMYGGSPGRGQEFEVAKE